MSHFTLASGKATATVSLRCPQCLALLGFTDTQWGSLRLSASVQPEDLYCNPACRDEHTSRLVMAANDVLPIFSYDYRNELEDLMVGFIPGHIARKLANMAHKGSPL